MRWTPILTIVALVLAGCAAEDTDPTETVSATGSVSASSTLTKSVPSNTTTATGSGTTTTTTATSGTTTSASATATTTATTTTTGTSAPEGEAPEFPDDPTCKTDTTATTIPAPGAETYVTSEAPPFFWVYGESNGKPGLQRNDSDWEFTCTDPDLNIW